MADTLVQRISRVEIGPTISARAVRADPVAAALDHLQDSLKFGVSMYNEKKSQVDRENMETVENFYKAYEQAGVEKNEAELAQQFYAQYGRDINSLTLSHQRRSNEGTGRIAGQKWVQDLTFRVEQGEYRTHEDFQKAWDDNVRQIDEQFPGNDAYKTGFLEKGEQVYAQLAQKVFDQDLAARKDHAFNQTAQAVMNEMDAFDMAADPEEAALLFAPNMREEADQLKKQASLSTEEELEAPFLDSITTRAIDPEHAEGVAALADILLENGLIHTADGKFKLQQAKNSALQTVDNYHETPSLARQKVILAEIDKLRRDYGKKRDFDPKEVERISKMGGGWADEQMALARQRLQGAYGKSADELLTADQAADSHYLMDALINNDPDALLEKLRDEEWRAAHEQDKDGEATVKEYYATYEKMIGEHGRFFNTAKDRLVKRAEDEGWTLDQETEAVNKLAEAATLGGGFEELTDAYSAADTIVKEKQEKEKAKLTEEEPAVIVPDWKTANRNVIIYGAKLEEAKTKAQEAAAVYERIKIPEVGFAARRADPEDLADSRLAKQLAEAAKFEEMRLEKALARAREKRDRERKKLSQAGLTAEQKRYRDIYGGVASNPDGVAQFRN